MTNDVWGRIRQNLLKTVGNNNYTNWIEPLEFSELNGGVATFLVPTSFMGNWVSRNFGDNILQELKKAGEKVSRIEFSVPTRMATKASMRSPSGPSPIDDRCAASLVRP